MAQLEDIKKSISEMSTDDLIEMHRKIRGSRRTPKEKPKAVKDKASSLTKLVGKMSKEQAAALLEALGGDSDEG